MAASLNLFKLSRGLAKHRVNDYYAVLGLPLTADVAEIRKKFLVLAKSLHPDVFSLSELQRDWAEKYFAKMVSPSYKVLNNDYNRDEYFATLRYLAQDLKKTEEQPLVQSELAQKLLKLPHEVNYKEYVSEVAKKQYVSLSKALEYTNELSELNTVFLYSQKAIAQPSRAIATPEPAIAPVPVAAVPVVSKAQPKLVAVEALITKKKWVEAMVELKQAEKLDPTNSRVYALMGVVYLGQKAATMAKTCFQKALKLNPKDSIAMKYTGQSGTTTAAKDAKVAQPAPQLTKKEDNKGGLFGFFKK